MTATFRAYRATDEDVVVALWQRSWQSAYPAIDFQARLAWWRSRWRDETLRKANVIVAEEDNGQVSGFATVEPDTGYLDQIVVAPEFWGSGLASRLLQAARELCSKPLLLDVNRDNARAIGFYRREGFDVIAEGVNPNSGAPTLRMQFRV